MKKMDKKKNRLTLITLVTVVLVLVLLLISSMRNSVRQSVYSERKALLGRLCESSADIINQNISFMQSICDIVTANAERDLQVEDDISIYIDKMKQESGYNQQLFFFVDSDGRYYSSDNVYGKIVDAAYYIDTADDKLYYISSLPHINDQKAYMIFRNRLSSPLEVNFRQSKVEITYCGILYDIDNLNDTLSQEFAGENNTFIYSDDNGVMLYKNFGIRMLVNGYNIYQKFSQIDINFGEDPADLENTCRQRQTMVVAFDVGNEEYYFCSSPIADTEWSSAFIVQSTFLDSVSGNSLTNIIIYVALIVAVLGVSVVLLFLSFYSNLIKSRSIIEITELNNELDNATKAKSEFLSNMSHDIRTPINGIMGMTTIARNVEGNPQKTMDCLDKIEGASQHLLSLVNDVLDMSRIERGKIEIISMPLDVIDVCENCCNIINGQLLKRNIEFIKDFNGENTQLIGDNLHLSQIIINILSNAVKFTPDGGTIWFRCRESFKDEKQVTYIFEIEDTGIGMKKEFLNKIFDAFSQDEGGARSIYKGTGLGMAISKQLATLMNGDIAVESELDKGSKFTVTIPFVINNDVQKEEDLSVEDIDLTGVKVLLVEDNELNMDIAVELLSPSGVIITTAVNGQEAVDLFTNNEAHTFDIILMDVMMPIMNGLDATRAIRSLDREDAKTIPILAMTANAFDSDIQATKESGMNGHLSKPINIGEVIKTMAYHVRKQRLL